MKPMSEKEKIKVEEVEDLNSDLNLSPPQSRKEEDPSLKYTKSRERSTQFILKNIQETLSNNEESCKRLEEEVNSK